MVSISGIRGIVGSGLDPEVIVKYTNAYAEFVAKGKVVVGRDARITGEMVNQIVTGTLLAKGLDAVSYTHLWVMRKFILKHSIANF